MRIRPLRGYRWTGGGLDGTLDATKIVAPPYDQISRETQDALYALHPDNVVRVSFPRDAAEAGGLDRYADARVTLDRWLATGVWAADDRPAIYPYTQTYRVADREVTRTGFVALGEVSEYAEGVVLPHERTHAGPKRDRMRLLEATGADTGLLFMLVSDAAGSLREATSPSGEPIAEARDLKGELHRLWRITDAAAVARVTSLMAGRQAIIADGHHRYETALARARTHPDARGKLMAFFGLEAPGLTIFPNHRLVHHVDGFDFEDFVDLARRWFDAEPLADPVAFRPENRTLGVVSGRDAAVLRLRADRFDWIAWPETTSPAWRALAVSILHEGLLRPLLDITDAKLDARTHVDYTADQAEAVALTRAGRCQAAFLIAPTTPEELLAVVRGGELLPQKSTHFYPKLLDGLVFHRVGDDA